MFNFWSNYDTHNRIEGFNGFRYTFKSMNSVCMALWKSVSGRKKNRCDRNTTMRPDKWQSSQWDGWSRPRLIGGRHEKSDDEPSSHSNDTSTHTHKLSVCCDAFVCSDSYSNLYSAFVCVLWIVCSCRSFMHVLFFRSLPSTYFWKMFVPNSQTLSHNMIQEPERTRTTSVFRPTDGCIDGSVSLFVDSQTHG